MPESLFNCCPVFFIPIFFLSITRYLSMLYVIQIYSYLYRVIYFLSTKVVGKLVQIALKFKTIQFMSI